MKKVAVIGSNFAKSAAALALAENVVVNTPLVPPKHPDDCPCCRGNQLCLEPMDFSIPKGTPQAEIEEPEFKRSKHHKARRLRYLARKKKSAIRKKKRR